MSILTSSNNTHNNPCVSFLRAKKTAASLFMARPLSASSILICATAHLGFIILMRVTHEDPIRCASIAMIIVFSSHYLSLFRIADFLQVSCTQVYIDFLLSLKKKNTKQEIEITFSV